MGRNSDYSIKGTIKKAATTLCALYYASKPLIAFYIYAYRQHTDRTYCMNAMIYMHCYRIPKSGPIGVPFFLSPP